MSEKLQDDDERSVTPETAFLSDISGSEEEGKTKQSMCFNKCINFGDRFKVVSLELSITFKKKKKCRRNRKTMKGP